MGTAETTTIPVSSVPVSVRSRSVEPLPSKETVKGPVPLTGVAETFAVGAWLAASFTLMTTDVEFVAPSSSVTVNTAVN